MSLDGLANVDLGFFKGFAGCHAARKPINATAPPARPYSDHLALALARILLLPKIVHPYTFDSAPQGYFNTIMPATVCTVS
jgi:hypothetical protein